MAMNPEIKQQWIATLRGPEYTKGSGVLRNTENKFCCLGVLCDMYQRDHAGVDWLYQDNSWYFKGNRDVLPIDVQRWAGIEKSDPWINTEGAALHHPYKASSLIRLHISELNDEQEMTFDEIADAIEADEEF